MTVTKSILAKEISNQLDLSADDSKIFVDTFFKLKKKFLKKHNLKISKFGSFQNKTSPKRVGRNPKTLEEHIISKRSKISFVLFCKV